MLGAFLYMLVTLVTSHSLHDFPQMRRVLTREYLHLVRSSASTVQRSVSMASQTTRAASLCTATTKVELLDGGTGEELFRLGMPDDRKIWSAAALVHDQYHELLLQVHASFLRAGSDYITCNNYGVTPGVGFTEEEIIKYCDKAGQLAQRAKQVADKPGGRVCGSLPPLVESYRPDRIPEFDQGVHLYSVIGCALRPHVDCFLAETLSTIDEAKMALTGVHGYKKPVMVSFTLNTLGQLRSGQDTNQTMRELIHFRNSHAPSVDIHAVLFNCSLPEAVTKALTVIREDEELQTAMEGSGVRLGAYANRLTPIPDDWALAESSEPQAMRTDIDVEHYVQSVIEWVGLGARVIGGCCGIGPEFIEAIDKKLKESNMRA